MGTRRRFAFAFTCAMLLPALAVALLVFVVDPFQHYRASERYLPEMNMRYLAPGLARHHAHDAIILGDSLAQNFVPENTSRTLHERVLNLSEQGATLYEQRMALDTALGAGPLRHVIWAVTLPRSAEAPDASRLGAGFPTYLYDDNPLNDVPYLFNQDTLVNSLLLISGRRANPRLFTVWFTHPGQASGRANVIASYRQTLADLAAQRPNVLQNVLAKSSHMTRSLDRNVIEPIRANPQIHFTVFIPPFSMLYYVTVNQISPAAFQTQLGLRHYLYTRLMRMPNVTVYDFDTPDITRDLDNYKDLAHYGVAVNQRLIWQIAQGRGRLLPDRRDPAIGTFGQHIRALVTDDFVHPGERPDPAPLANPQSPG